MPGLSDFHCSNKKSPRGIRPRCCSPSVKGAKCTLTQDISSSDVAENCDEYLFGRAQKSETASDRHKKTKKNKKP